MTETTSSPTQDGTGIPFIGAGPGDPELITVRGRRLLAAADVIVYAGSLINDALIDRYGGTAEIIDSAGKDLETLVPAMASAYHDGQTVVRVHSGDPSIYGAAREQMDALADRGIPTYVVPGVTAAFAAAGALGTQLTLPSVANHVVFTRPQGRTLTADHDRITEFAAMDDVTTCIYLGTHAIAEMMERLLTAGIDPDAPVAVIYRASWPEEDVLVGTVSTIAEQVADAGYESSALVIVGEVAADPAYDRSLLYDGWTPTDDTR